MQTDTDNTDVTDVPDVQKHVRIVLPADLHRGFRVALARDGKTAQGMLEGVIRRYVELAEERK